MIARPIARVSVGTVNKSPLNVTMRRLRRKDSGKALSLANRQSRNNVTNAEWKRAQNVLSWARQVHHVVSLREPSVLLVYIDGCDGNNRRIGGWVSVVGASVVTSGGKYQNVAVVQLFEGLIDGRNVTSRDKTEINDFGSHTYGPVDTSHNVGAKAKVIVVQNASRENAKVIVRNESDDAVSILARSNDSADVRSCW
jgi:hypothetical protein